MIDVKKQNVGENAAVYIVENAPPEFDTFLKRAINESCGIYHRFESGTYRNMTLKEAFFKDGKKAIIEIAQYLENTYNSQYFNELKAALKYFVKSERKSYSLENILVLKNVLNEEIKEYEEKFGINLEAEVENLDEETKNKIRDFILF